MKESVLSQEMQDTLEQLLIEQQDLPEVFSLAILQQYSRQKELSEKADTYVSSYYMPIVQRVFI